MSTSIVMEHELYPIATELEVQEEDITYEEAEEYAKRFLRVGRFYWTNAGFPKELDCSNDEYTKSPLRSFHPLPPLGSLILERELLRVSTDTTIRHKKIQGGKKKGKKKGKNPFNYKRPCYLVEYDKSMNQGVIFLGTSTPPNYANRFAIVHTGSPMTNSLRTSGSLGTMPPNSFPRKSYLNISHPLRVQFAYLPKGQFPCSEKGRICYDDYKPPRVAIAKFLTQPPDLPIISNDGLETSIVLDKESVQLFWKMHKEYHRLRPIQLGPKDDSGGGGLNDDSGGGGPDDDSGRARPNDDSGGAGPNDDSGRARPNDDSGGAGPNEDSGGAGPNEDSSGARPNDGGLSTCGTRPSTCGVGSNRGGFSSREAEDAPWGRVGNQRIGIDIPLVIEDMYSDSDEEMDLEESVINLDANDAPWGRVGDQRIGIDIPLVIEDIYSDSEEEMDLESVEEFREVDNIANVVKPESSDHKGITTWPNPSDKDSSSSYTISKPYFTISGSRKSECALLDHDHSTGKWRWTMNAFNGIDMVVSTEGLSYQHPFFLNMDHDYGGQRGSARRIFNWHTQKYTVLPPPPMDSFDFDNYIVGMIVDTSVWPYAFKVIESSNPGTMIYDSTTHSWTHRLLMEPPLTKNRFSGNANVASCKGVAFIVDFEDQIVVCDVKKDKWDRIKGPGDRVNKKLRGIGSWDDRIFSSTAYMSENALAIEIQELVDMDMAEPEWKEFAAMPGEMCSWLTGGMKDDHIFKIYVSFCSENLLIWARSDSSLWASFSFDRPVLCNLAHKTWVKLELPLHPLTDPGPGNWKRKSAFQVDEGTQLTSMTPDET